MVAARDSLAVMARPKSNMRLKNFPAPPELFDLLETASSLLTKAQGSSFSEAEIIRRLLLEHVAAFALDLAPDLLDAQLAELQRSDLKPDVRAAAEAEVRAGVKRRMDELRAIVKRIGR